MNKRLSIVVLAVAVLVLALPLLNLVFGPPANRLMELQPEDPLAARTVSTIAGKCVHCHTSEPATPFYAALPVARGMIESDIRAGSSRVNFLEEFTAGPEQVPSEIVLAKTEHVVRAGSMPPARYRLLHWNHGVSDAERDALLEWIGATRFERYSDPRQSADLASLVVRPLVEPSGLDPDKVELGRALFHDKRLSADDTVSCATCHDLAMGGTDRIRFSVGVGGAEGGINSPTVYNSGHFFAQFWDGRAADLEEQADGPVNNPIEMASNWDDAIANLEKDRKFVKAFRAVYPDGLAKESLIDAIATFERTLVTPDSAFDRYLLGDDGALTAEQRRGHELFEEYACATCHAGPAMGGLSYETLGLVADYFSDGARTDADLGRFNVTGHEEDRHRFKVPTLRNVAVTYPYLHDGSTGDLDEVVRIMARHQVGREMPDEDAALVAAFLESLTGKYEGVLLR